MNPLMHNASGDPFMGKYARNEEEPPAAMQGTQTIKKARNRRNSGWEPEFLLPALSAAANSVIYVCVNSLICSLDALACRLFEGL